MTIDTPTMLVALLIGYALLVLDLALAHRPLLASRPELRLWTIGSSVMLLGFVGIVLRPVLPLGPAILLSNGLLSAGCALYAHAMHRFVVGRGLPASGWMAWLGGLAGLAALLVLETPYASLTVYVSLWLAWQLLPLVTVIVRHGWQGERSLRTVASTGALCVGALLVRAGHAGLHPELYPGLLQPGLVQGLTFLTAFICVLGGGFGFMLANLERVAQQMERLARIDELTGCLTRGALVSSLDQVARQCRGAREPLALALLDLDHFKQVNDTHGHRTGDAVLRGFAAEVRQRLRPKDLFGRMGGEEFCLVLPGTDRQGAHALVEGLRHAIERLDVPSPIDGASVRVTVSAGLVVAPPSPASPSIEQLYGLADELLYRAKREGRNRVRAG